MFRFGLGEKTPTFDQADWPVLSGHMTSLAAILPKLADDIVNKEKLSDAVLKEVQANNMPLAMFAIQASKEMGSRGSPGWAASCRSRRRPCSASTRSWCRGSSRARRRKGRRRSSETAPRHPAWLPLQFLEGEPFDSLRSLMAGSPGEPFGSLCSLMASRLAGAARVDPRPPKHGL